MITIKVIVATVILLIVLSIIPRIIIYDSIDLTSEEIKCAKQESNLLFDNPIEKIMIQKLAVEKKKMVLAKSMRILLEALNTQRLK